MKIYFKYKFLGVNDIFLGVNRGASTLWGYIGGNGGPEIGVVRKPWNGPFGPLIDLAGTPSPGGTSKSPGGPSVDTGQVLMSILEDRITFLVSPNVWLT